MIEDSYPLSPMQQGMLFHSLYEQNSGIYIEQIICRSRENLNVSVLRQSWQRVVERHSILRTSFEWEELDQLIQFVHTQVQLPLEQQDWRELSKLEQENQLQIYLQSDRQRGFNLKEPPLMRLAIFLLDETDYKLVWTFHHSLLDGRSFLIVVKEVFAFYESFCRNQDLQLEKPHPYRDYIDWLQQKSLSKAEEFWRHLLQGFTAPTLLLSINSDSSVATDCELPTKFYGLRELRLSVASTSALQSLAEKHQLTLNTVVQGAWALLLSRYSGSDDVVFGATRSCRNPQIHEIESMVGLFINTLPMRIQVKADTWLLPWLKELRMQWLTLRDYEYTSLVQIQEWSEIPKGLPLFESIIIFENYQLDAVLRSQGGNWEQRDFQLLEQTNYPLTLAAYAGSDLLLKINYDCRRFDEGAIERMLGHLETILESMAANPQQRLSELPLLTEAERYQLLVEWNNTQVNYPKDLCIHQLFENQVEQTPDAVAVVFEDQQLTYWELNHRANQLAHHLQKLGVKPNQLVGISVERSLTMIVGLLGILKAGGAYVPLDPNYPQERLDRAIADGEIALLLTQEKFQSRFSTPSLHQVYLDRDWLSISQESEDNPINQVDGDNLAYIIYTTGSTGKPKGVMIPHRCLINFTQAAIDQYEITSHDRVLQFASISFDAAAEEIYPCLTAGGTLVLRTDEMLSSPATFLQVCQDWQLTVLDLPTAYWQQIVAELATRELTVPNCLRLVIIGGERAIPEAVKIWQDVVGNYPQLINTYGPTETTVVATTYRVDKSIPIQKEVPIGTGIANVKTYILDPKLQPLPIGIPGELHIGGAGLALGYLNQVQLTEEKFIYHRFRDDLLRLYKTGDRVRYLKDGNIEFLGRIDRQVKIRGFRIELGEIEAVLVQHPNVREAVVIAKEILSGNQCLVAYIVPKQVQVALTDELYSFLKQKLPNYMMPSTLMVLDTLPLTPNGKVDRQALPIPKQKFFGHERVYLSPRDLLEFRLTLIWENVLGIQPIGIRDNFFDLGGHSLLAVRLFAQIKQKLGNDLPLNILLQAPTIEQIAGILRYEKWLPPPLSLVTTHPDGSKQPFFMVMNLIIGFLDLGRLLGSDQPLYGFNIFAFPKLQNLSTKIEDIAAFYISELQAVKPQGPYLLGGYCLGSIIAFEMAHQLQMQDQKVSLLILLEPPPPFSTKFLPNKINRFIYHLDKLLQLSSAERLNYFLEKVSKLRATIVSQSRATYNNYQSQQPQNKPYVPKSYPGRITLFLSSDTHLRLNPECDPRLKWGQLAAGGLEVYEVPGNHSTLLSEPHIQVLAEKLRACLDKAQTDNTDFR
ncbi:amino acid adenylation domain-containing protein [Aerosakkonemataceae cyanobacterium BLCC-F50]|uniref:Amino acid adenylation domain-containing protein n=1 Tax=Floridaenema flaviceps BLCC-F50 TaxID=3153642 RepID=A0ABV4XTV6_9CYAN